MPVHQQYTAVKMRSILVALVSLSLASQSHRAESGSPHIPSPSNVPYFTETEGTSVADPERPMPLNSTQYNHHQYPGYYPKGFDPQFPPYPTPQYPGYYVPGRDPRQLVHSPAQEKQPIVIEKVVVQADKERAVKRPHLRGVPFLLLGLFMSFVLSMFFMAGSPIGGAMGLALIVGAPVFLLVGLVRFIKTFPDWIRWAWNNDESSIALGVFSILFFWLKFAEIKRAEDRNEAGKKKTEL